MERRVLAGIIAHELAHYLLQWEEDWLSYPENIYYFADKGDLLLGYQVEQNHDLKREMWHWFYHKRFSGPFSNEELNGIPFHNKKNKL